MIVTWLAGGRLFTCKEKYCFIAEYVSLKKGVLFMDIDIWLLV